MARQPSARRASLAALTVVLTGCSVRADAPSRAEPTITVPPLERVSDAVPRAARVKVPTLASESAERRARRLTVRVRNVSCLGVATGSGFAVDTDVLITNRHVLAGAELIEISTWDGRSLDASAAVVGALGDLGVARVRGTLPLAGSFGKPPRAAAAITVVGYPRGGRLTLTQGTVVDLIDGGRLGVPGRIMRLTAHVEPGNSGGPVLNQAGKIVGVIYAVEVATGFALAIPVDTLRSLARIGGFQELPPCGSE